MRTLLPDVCAFEPNSTSASPTALVIYAYFERTRPIPKGFTHVIEAMFDTRTTAGRALADELVEAGVEADVVLAIPRGGLPVGRAVADALDAPLDVVVAKKVGAPGNPELAIGAVASDGTSWLNDELVANLGVDDERLEVGIEDARATAATKLERYRGERAPLDVAGKRVVVVDDGVATGATTRACLRQLRAGGADSLVLAVPVGPPDTLVELEAEADDIVTVERPASFYAVGAHYRDFSQVSDDEAVTYLEE
jgi:predicted phosphoribosyltransferase